MRYVAAAGLGPGVVYKDVVVGWINNPLWALRPRTGPMEDRRLASEAAAYPPTFIDGEDEVLANAKRRPVLVVASHRELRPPRQIRVVPIHRKGEKRFFVENWDRIVAGQIAGLVMMPAGRPDFDFDEGVLDLTEAQRIRSEFLPAAPWFAVDAPSLAGIVAAAQELFRSALASPR